MNTQGSKHSFDTIDGKTNFSPSLWKQRRHFALQLLEQHACQRVIDFGCGQGSLLQELLNSPLFTRIAGLDISSSALAKAAATSKRSHVDTRMNRETQVQLDLYEGSLADADERFLDFDALTCLEVVEHLDPEVLDALPMTVFELYRPRLAIFSTPNAEFNVNFPELNYGTSESIYRHGDHRFEWKRDEFQQWANKIALQYGYLVTFSGVGTFTDDTEFGHCSQIAVFIRIGPFSNSIPVDRSYKHISTISYPTIQPGQMTIVPRIAQQQQAQSRGFVRGTSRKQECREIPRNYQIQVFEKACEKNILAVIDTGTGKTLIAIMLLRHMADSVYIRPFGIQDMSKLEAISNELPAYQAESQTEYQVHADMAIAAAVSNGLATNGLDNKMESRASCAIFLVPTVALVSQQATYIRSNSNLKTSKLWGGCLTGNVQLLIQILTADVWRKEVIDADVIVMTPELLRQAVVMKFIDMGDIHLLVFDECHHATGNHPYNAIMALVVASPLDSQPRIFGMTASPVNSKRGVDVSLEPNKEMLEPYLLPPTEHIVYYDQTTYTTYPKLLSDIIHNCPILQEVLTGIAGDFDVMLGLYGPWILEKAITRTIVCLYPALEMAIAEPLSKQATMFTAYFENELQVILAYIEPKIKGFSEDQLVIVKEIPSKITALVDILSGYSDKRLCGIVFVKERVVAQLLTDLLNAHPTLGFIKAASVMGHSRGSRTKSLANLLSMTLAQQQNVFAKFALGEINLLVATSVAEEGIDINPCNVVIRFDWGDTLINYVQSRGRSRTKDSDYYILAQNGDNSIEARLDGFKSAEKQISAKLSMIMDVETIGLESFVIKESGIEVTIENAKWMLGEYCSMLPVTDERACCQYDHYTSGGVFQAKITLPQIVPQDYRVHIGTACPSLHAAVARASFDMLLILDKYGELDGLGTPQDQAHDLFSDLPAGPGKNANIMRECIPEIPPIFTGKYVNRDIYLYKISLISKESKIMMNIGMLTSGQCPTDLNTFKIPIHNEFFTVRFELHPDKLRLSQEKINLAGKFHTALFQVISRVELDESLAWSPLCVPLKSKDFCRASAYTAIDWKQILDLQNEPPLMSSFDLTDPRCLEDIAVVDQYRFRHVYFPVEIDKSRTPMSKYYNPSSGDLGEGFENIAAMYKIRFACGLDIDADQPIINAMPIDLLYSCWIPKRQRFTSPLIPQLLKVHPINRKYIIDTLYLPCILTHYLHLLNMRDLKASLGIDGITPQILHNACTSVSANSDCDYETLETFGDSFLKLHLSIHAFVRQPLSHEGELSKLRTQFESNLAFSKAARESLKLENRIQTMPISRKTFVPPHYPSTQVVQLSDKSIADVLEAIVGACVVHCNFEVGCKAIRAFLGDEMEPSWEQYMKMWDLQPRLPQPTQEFKGSVRILQKRIGFKFDQATYLCFCIMHSTSHRDMNVFQRLEFLGDAVLGFAATRYLYAMDDRMTPFQISYARSLLVNNHFLSWISFELTLPMHMRHSDISISQATLAGGKQHKTAHADLKNFVADGNSLPWKTEDTPPKMFADQVEALIGAMFLDSRFDFKRVELFIFKEIFDPWWKFILPVFTAETAWIESHKRKRAGFGDN